MANMYGILKAFGAKPEKTPEEEKVTPYVQIRSWTLKDLSKSKIPDSYLTSIGVNFISPDNRCYIVSFTNGVIYDRSQTGVLHLHSVDTAPDREDFRTVEGRIIKEFGGSLGEFKEHNDKDGFRFNLRREIRLNEQPRQKEIAETFLRNNDYFLGARLENVSFGNVSKSVLESAGLPLEQLAYRFSKHL
jgi:hypothetical protein